MFHWKILGRAHDDRLWLWRFALSPKHECWCDLELLWNHRLQGEHGAYIGRVVGFHRHSFDLSAGAIADVERGRDFTFLSRWHFLFMRLRSESATARSADRFKVYRFVAGVLIFEMTYRLLVSSSRM